MNETYVECLVKKKTPAYLAVARTLLLTLTVLLAAAGILLLILPALLFAIAFGVASYFVYMNTNLEYEYLYVDKELTIDKIMSKAKRKRIGVFPVEKMEIVAPMKSWHLDNFKNRNDKTCDYSSGEVRQPETRYVFYYEGRQKVIFEPNEELVKALQFAAPRKVFLD